MSRIQLYILSRDRPAYLEEMLLSALNQSTSYDFEIIVSDNSEENFVFNLVAMSFPSIKYIRRTPAVSALEHFKIVINESNSEYVVFFHDDDVLFPTYIEQLAATLDSNKNIAAIGCNAYILKNMTASKKTVMKSFSGFKIFELSNEFLKPYMEITKIGPAPFPGYMYRRRFLDGLELKAEHGGKYSDLTFLLKLLRRGPIAWTSESLMYYRLHSLNDTKTESIPDRLSLLRYLYTNEGVNKYSNAVSDMRFVYWKSWWIQSSNGSFIHLPKSKREYVILKFLIFKALAVLITKPFILKRRFFPFFK
jgi:cellulose synthase/poly-beta-1,6-N-acetylglucosamine synthase-like glycosyltransferase